MNNYKSILAVLILNCVNIISGVGEEVAESATNEPAFRQPLSEYRKNLQEAEARIIAQTEAYDKYLADNGYRPRKKPVAHEATSI